MANQFFCLFLLVRKAPSHAKGTSLPMTRQAHVKAAIRVAMRVNSQLPYLALDLEIMKLSLH